MKISEVMSEWAQENKKSFYFRLSIDYFYSQFTFIARKIQMDHMSE